MNVLLYAVRDTKGGFYLPIMQVKSEIEAIRSFTEIAVTSDTPISKYPADFDLYQFGEFDNLTGEFSVGVPTFVLNGLTAVQDSRRLRRQYAAQLH